jgi:uncharacterized repeat protein (TIGR03803 family)
MRNFRSVLPWTVVLPVLCVLVACGTSHSPNGPPPPPPPAFTLLYSFTGGADGGNPSTVTMAQDAQGSLYGTTQFGADVNCNVSTRPGCGTVWKLDTAGNLTVLYTWAGGTLGGGGSGLVQDGAGNLYGTAWPGTLAHGFVFELDQGGTLTDLYDFAGGSDGDGPTGNLFRDAAGNLYGTTLLGGGSNDPLCPNSQGCGTVFEVGANGQYKLLYSFLNSADGSGPQSLVGDSSGNVYGVTSAGGQGCQPTLGCGTVFRLDAYGHKNVLYYFTGGSDGSAPWGNLTLDSAGNLYGTTQSGGDLNCPMRIGTGCGAIFKIAPNGTETVLYAFHGGSDGDTPVSVIPDGSGNFYGTTQGGPNPSPCGTVFKLDGQGNLTNLHSPMGAEGCGPVGALVRDSAGNLFVATALGGDENNGTICYNGCGTVLKIKP